MSDFHEHVVVAAETLGADACQELLARLIAPRPIAWISTRSEAGRPNLAPFSSCCPLASDPPLIGVSIQPGARGPKDTLVNIRATGCFCVNVVTESSLEAMARTAPTLAPDVDEFELAGLSTASGASVNAPLVRSASAALECRLVRELSLPPSEATLIVGRVIAFRLRPSARDTPRNATDLAEPPSLPPLVGHLHADRFVLTDNPISLPTPAETT